MNNNADKYYSLADIQRLFHVPVVTVRYWIKQGWLRSYQGIPLGGNKGISKYRKNGVYIKEEDWLDFPSFMRKR